MKISSTILAATCLIVLTVLSGVIHGRLTNRFGVSAKAQAAAGLLQQVPERVGDWQCDNSGEMSETTVQMLRCEDYFARRYVNQRTGEVVEVSVILGPPGPIAEHTPEICISGRAYRLLGPRRKVTIGAGSAGVAADAQGHASPDELWVVDFRRNSPPADVLRVYYGWSTGRQWSAPPPGFVWDWKALRFRGARAVFSAEPYLYKIQASTAMLEIPDTAAEEPGEDAVRQFLEDFLPVLRSYLVHPDQPEVNRVSGS